MATSISQTSNAAKTLAIQAAEVAEHFGMAQSAAEANSNAKVIQYSDIAQQSEQAQQPAKSDNRTCDATDSFTNLITAAITLGSGSRERSRQALQADYVAAHAYENAGDHKESYKAALEQQCADAKPKIDVTDRKTTPFHMIVKLTFTDVTKQFVSDKVHVLRVALAHDVKPDGFLQWLEDEKGERKIVVTYNRDGSLKSTGSSGSRKTSGTTQTDNTHERSAQIERARKQLAPVEVLSIDPTTVTQKLAAPETYSECAAIILHRHDGSIVIKALVQDSVASEEIYSAYFRANTDEIERSEICETIEKLLESDDDLNIGKIRKELGDEIADRINASWATDKQWNADVSETPAALQEYVSKLTTADRLRNVDGERAAESAYQGALEELEQTLDADPSLRQYLDRDWSDDISPDKESVPRLNNSKSMERKGTGPQIISKDQSLREALRAELDNLRGAHVTDTHRETARLANAMQLANRRRTLN
jgi:hypothetical protein